jgi:hypothetical protein
MDVLLGPAHFGNVDQAFDAFFQFHERTVVGDVGHAALDAHADRVLGFHAFPRIAFQLLHAKADALGFRVDLDDLDLDGLADRQNVGRMVDAAPRHVGDVQQAVDAAQVNERTVIGDVLDHAFDHLAFGEVLHQFRTLFGTGLFQIARRDTTMLPRRLSIFRIWNGCGMFISGVTSRTGRMSTWLRGRNATAPSRSTVKPPLTRLKITPSTRSLSSNFLQTDPAFFAAGLVARQHGFAHGVFDAVEENFDFIADAQFLSFTGGAEFAQRHAAFGLQANVDDGQVVLDGNDLALDDAAFGVGFFVEARIEHGREIVAGRGESLGFSHSLTFFQSTYMPGPRKSSQDIPFCA